MSQIFHISVDLSKQRWIFFSSRNALPKHGTRKAAIECLIAFWQTRPAYCECHNVLLNWERKQNLLNVEQQPICQKLFWRWCRALQDIPLQRRLTNVSKILLFLFWVCCCCCLTIYHFPVISNGFLRIC